MISKFAAPSPPPEADGVLGRQIAYYNRLRGFGSWSTGSGRKLRRRLQARGTERDVFYVELGGWDTHAASGDPWAEAWEILDSEFCTDAGPGCYCKDGFVLDEADGTCIPEDECPGEPTDCCDEVPGCATFYDGCNTCGVCY